jgi:predicted RNase H-like HicB family nuclease
MGEIPDCPGVNADVETRGNCREKLAEVREGWILLRVSRNLPLPVVDGINLAIEGVA